MSTASMQDRFKGMKGARGTTGGSYLGLGRHRLKIKKLEYIESSDPQKKGTEYAIHEFEIVTSDNPTHRVGATFSWLVDMDKTAALNNLRAFVEAMAPQMGWTKEALEAMSDEQWGALMASLYGEKQPFLGRLIDAEGYNKPTRAGKDFTRFNWTAVAV